MLARTRLRRFAIGALSDDFAPHGPDCSCTGPLAKDCDGLPVEIMDSPTGYLVDRLTKYGDAAIGLPAISVFVEQSESSDFSGGHLGDTLSVPLDLVIEFYVTGETDWQAEDALDALQERIMYRLMRRDPVVVDGVSYPTIYAMTPDKVRVNTERENEDRRVFARQLSISVNHCEKFDAPTCGSSAPLCVSVTTSADC